MIQDESTGSHFQRAPSNPKSQLLLSLPALHDMPLVGYL